MHLVQAINTRQGLVEHYQDPDNNGGFEFGTWDTDMWPYLFSLCSAPEPYGHSFIEEVEVGTTFTAKVYHIFTPQECDTIVAAIRETPFLTHKGKGYRKFTDRVVVRDKWVSRLITLFSGHDVVFYGI